MTTLSPDLELLRMELGRAFERDLARSVSRRRRRMFVAVAFATFVSAASSVAIANDSAADALSRAASRVMSVFRGGDDPSASRDARAEAEQMQQLDAHNPASMRPGALQVDSARRLLDARGDGYSVTIVAIPTDRDEVCYRVRITYADPASAGDPGVRNCVDRLTVQRPEHHSWTSSEHFRDTVYGITGDEVERVEIRTSRGVEQASLGTNAFFWIAPDASLRATGLVLHLHDGTELPLPITNPTGAPE